ncbi:diguanylate cyclase [Roseibium denhamense]|uniref:diguanylate cyclase n=1 Tax=Roseibium denhamense TaxID=76305 RepID=A0ABY1NJ01_9HYPH|nr:GGDEF domain-containing protein [Roseibium denhamense]MTI06412.1 diguanylate cyclase [Roseibium denhamense]SMP08911.1 diguanylate cyclase (GGDEF) domain-containing protein [Roseibium denhamense]
MTITYAAISDDGTIQGDATLILEDSAKRRPADEDRKPGIVFIDGLDTGRSFIFTKPQTVIGRSKDSDIKVRERDISRRHVMFDVADDGVQVIDLRSRNGVYVNGIPVERQYLENNDVVQIGSDVSIRFSMLTSAEIEFLKEMYRAAVYDSLTDTYNRRHFQNVLENCYDHRFKKKSRLALLIVDIDHFKRLNDTFGHQIGDRALCHVASLIKDAVRNGDTVCRYGGEEFAVLLMDIDLERAKEIAERIRMAVEENPMVTESFIIPMTVSVGGAAIDEAATDPERLFGLADSRMYGAKQAGRNKVFTG